MSNPSTSTRRRSPLLRATLLGMELFVAVGAVYGAAMLVTNAWHLPVSDLSPLPLHSWALPGLAVFLIVAVPMLVAAILVGAVVEGPRRVARRRRAPGRVERRTGMPCPAWKSRRTTWRRGQ